MKNPERGRAQVSNQSAAQEGLGAWTQRHALQRIYIYPDEEPSLHPGTGTVGTFVALHSPPSSPTVQLLLPSTSNLPTSSNELQVFGLPSDERRGTHSCARRPLSAFLRPPATGTLTGARQHRPCFPRPPKRRHSSALSPPCRLDSRQRVLRALLLLRLKSNSRNVSSPPPPPPICRITARLQIRAVVRLLGRQHNELDQCIQLYNVVPLAHM